MAEPPLGAWVYARWGPDTLWRGVGALGVVTWAAFVALSLWDTHQGVSGANESARG